MQFGGQPVEHAVDVFMAVRAAKAFGQFDGFVDDDAVWRFRVVAQFVSTRKSSNFDWCPFCFEPT